MNELKTIKKIRFTIMLGKKAEWTCKAREILLDENSSTLNPIQFWVKNRIWFKPYGENEVKTTLLKNAVILELATNRKVTGMSP